MKEDGKKQDGRKFNGGNKNAGRKPKSDEQKLIEALSPYDSAVMEALIEKATIERDMNAIKLFMAYRFGQPKQKADVKIEGNISIDFSKMSNEELDRYISEGFGGTGKEG